MYTVLEHLNLLFATANGTVHVQISLVKFGMDRQTLSDITNSAGLRTVELIIRLVFMILKNH